MAFCNNLCVNKLEPMTNLIIFNTNFFIPFFKNRNKNIVEYVMSSGY